MHILVHMCAGTHGVKCSPSNSQEWSCLTVVVSDLMWVLGIKLQPSVKQPLRHLSSLWWYTSFLF